MADCYKAEQKINNLVKQFRILEEAQCLQADTELEKVVSQEKVEEYKSFGAYFGSGKMDCSAAAELDRIQMELYSVCSQIRGIYDVIEDDISPDSELHSIYEDMTDFHSRIEKEILKKQTLPKEISLLENNIKKLKN